MGAPPAHVPEDTSTPPAPSAALSPPSEPLRLRLRRAPVTAGLLAVCVLLHAVTLLATLAVAPDPLDTAIQSIWSLSLTDSAEIFRTLGALELSRVWLDGEWWRLLTTGLLHGSLLHLALNGIALVSIGEWVEQACGHLRTFALFALASLGGALASLAWAEAPIVLGASAGILGQAGALWLARRWGSPPIQDLLAPISATSLGFLILLCLALGLLIPGLAQAGHLGGLLLGLLLGGAWLARTRPLRLLLLALAALALLTLAWLGAAPTHRTHYYAFLGKRLLDDKRHPEALILFNEVFAREPDNASDRNNLAYTLANDGIELDYAESLARTALALDPLNPSYLDTLGWIRCRQGHIDDGTQLLRAALWLDTRHDPELEAHLEGCPTASALPPSVSRETLP